MLQSIASEFVVALMVPNYTCWEWSFAKACLLSFSSPNCLENMQVGDLVYARVEAADRDLEPTLTCMDAAGKVGTG